MPQVAQERTPRSDQNVEQEQDLAEVKLPPTPAPELSKLRTALGAIRQETARSEWLHPEGASAAERSNPGRVLVHIRQFHPPLEGAELTPEMRATVDEYLPGSQREQRAVLSALAENSSLPSIMLEGMDRRTAARVNRDIGLLRQNAPQAKMMMEALGVDSAADATKKYQTLQRQFGPNPGVDQQKILNGARFVRDYLSFAEQVAKNPVLRVAATRRVPIVGPEDPKLLRDNAEWARANPDAEVDDPKMAEFMNRRDQVAVEFFASREEKVGVLVLGAGHDLRAEIRAYNKAHPDKPITLVEVTPRTVERFLEDSSAQTR